MVYQFVSFSVGDVASLKLRMSSPSRVEIKRGVVATNPVSVV
jgi:hypothetical protein